ncbi:hypothetical protein BOTNAR_0342g00100 [Botryotinia narcissicola]|uniref:Uncharacterized protein n=1 Tax=Botryotinia narcissicola TaxID=278944 RepID=A0A4Z1HSZ8_9HELO|nr:hypothetical protein BOTNAR_0342g00100 [Botryotinia narcissicola]
MEPNNLYRSPNPSIQSMKAREMVDQQVGGKSSSKDYPLPVDPSSKCAFDHLTESQASVGVCVPKSNDWKSVEGRGSKLLEDSDIEMDMGVTGHENGEQIGVVIESVKPRVRLPLEDVKRELDKQKATSVPSKDEIILPKRMSLTQLMEIFPAVGDQINAKMDQKLSDAHKEYEMKFKRLQDEHNDELLRTGAVVGETESRLHDAEGKLRGLAGSGQRYSNELFSNALPGIQNSHGPARNTINSRQDPNPAAQSVNCQAPQAFVFGSPTALTNPFRNNGLATGDGQKRGCDEAIQPEFGRDVKRVKREQL